MASGGCFATATLLIIGFSSSSVGPPRRGRKAFGYLLDRPVNQRTQPLQDAPKVDNEDAASVRNLRISSYIGR
jgi:hypothetical protein